MRTVVLRQSVHDGHTPTMLFGGALFFQSRMGGTRVYDRYAERARFGDSVQRQAQGCGREGMRKGVADEFRDHQESIISDLARHRPTGQDRLSVAANKRESFWDLRQRQKPTRTAGIQDGIYEEGWMAHDVLSSSHLFGIGMQM